MRADPKPVKRHIDKKAGYDKLAREGRCRVSGTPWRLTRFHAVPRDMGGDDIDVNIIPICWELHHEWEQAPDGKKMLGPGIWAAMFDDERAYVLEKKGVDWIRRYYAVEL